MPFSVVSQARRISPWGAVAVYAVGGLILGLVFLPLIPVVRALGLPRDSSVGIALFVLMPLLIIVLGMLDQNYLRNLLGVLLSMLAWSFGYAIACLIQHSGVGMIGFSLIIMALYMVPSYLVLAILVCALARRLAPRN